MLEFARALLRAWRAVVGALPNKEQAGVLWAHFAGETGDGAYCWNQNLGNVKHVPGSGVKFMSLAGVWECLALGDEDKDGDVDADDRVMLIARLVRTGAWREDASADHAKACGPSRVSLLASGDNAMSWFRAYDSLEEGMNAFVARKANPTNRYASAWAFALAGDHDGYARELGRKKYLHREPRRVRGCDGSEAPRVDALRLVRRGARRAPRRDRGRDAARAPGVAGHGPAADRASCRRLPAARLRPRRSGRGAEVIDDADSVVVFLAMVVVCVIMGALLFAAGVYCGAAL